MDKELRPSDAPRCTMGPQPKNCGAHTTTHPSSLGCPSLERRPPLTASSVRPNMRVVTRNARWDPPLACGCSCSISLNKTGELVFGGGTGGRDGRSALGDHQGDFFSSSNGDGDREGVNGGADFGPPLPLPLAPIPRAYAATGLEERSGRGDGLWGDDALAMRCGGRMSENEARRLCLRAEVELR